MSLFLECLLCQEVAGLNLAQDILFFFYFTNLPTNCQKTLDSDIYMVSCSYSKLTYV